MAQGCSLIEIATQRHCKNEIIFWYLHREVYQHGDYPSAPRCLQMSSPKRLSCQFLTDRIDGILLVERGLLGRPWLLYVSGRGAGRVGKDPDPFCQPAELRSVQHPRVQDKSASRPALMSFT